MGMDEDALPGARLVVVKQGADPVLLRGKVRAEIAVPVVADAIDTTGAGDAFAGTLAAAIADGAGPLAALERAVAAGTAAVTRHGAQDWALDR